MKSERDLELHDPVAEAMPTLPYYQNEFFNDAENVALLGFAGRSPESLPSEYDNSAEILQRIIHRNRGIGAYTLLNLAEVDISELTKAYTEVESPLDDEQHVTLGYSSHRSDFELAA